MAKIIRALTIAALVDLSGTLLTFEPGRAATFNDYDCTDDCQGHAAGYRWSERHGIDDENSCPDGHGLSFNEGCKTYVKDPNRGADEDDDGKQIPD